MNLLHKKKIEIIYYGQNIKGISNFVWFNFFIFVLTILKKIFTFHYA